MLQIISGKFFDTEDRYHTNCKAVLYSNMHLRGSYQFAHVKIESTDLNSEISTYIISYDNQLQKLYGGFQPIKIGNEKIVFQFMNIISFVLNCIVDKNESEVRNLCMNHSTTGRKHLPTDFITSTLNTNRDIKEEEVRNASNIVERIMGLSRKDYLNVLNCIVAYNDSIRYLTTDVSLAYSMLVYSLEALAQKYDNYKTTWDDYNQELRVLLEKVFQDIDFNKAEEIKNILISNEHLKLSQRFEKFVNSYVAEPFFINIPHRFTIRKDDLSMALKNAYKIRSQYAHNLDPIMNQIADGLISKEHDIIKFDHNVYFTYSGLQRIVREVIINFVNSQPQFKYEKIDWQVQLPNMTQAELPPYLWIFKEDYPNAKLSKIKFEGFIECLIHHKNNIPPMEELVLHYLGHLAEMKSENKSAAYALCYIYYSVISNISFEVKDKMEAFINSNINLLYNCNIYNIVTALMVKVPADLEWETTEFLQIVEKYRKNKYKKNSINLPNEVDLLLYTKLANSFKEDDDIEQQKSWLEIAYYNANNFCDIQKHIKECYESNQLFDYYIIWKTIDCLYSTPEVDL